MSSELPLTESGIPRYYPEPTRTRSLLYSPLLSSREGHVLFSFHRRHLLSISQAPRSNDWLLQTFLPPGVLYNDVTSSDLFIAERLCIVICPVVRYTSSFTVKQATRSHDVYRLSTPVLTENGANTTPSTSHSCGQKSSNRLAIRFHIYRAHEPPTVVRLGGIRAFFAVVIVVNRSIEIRRSFFSALIVSLPSGLWTWATGPHGHEYPCRRGQRLRPVEREGRPYRWHHCAFRPPQATMAFLHLFVRCLLGGLFRHQNSSSSKSHTPGTVLDF